MSQSMAGQQLRTGGEDCTLYRKDHPPWAWGRCQQPHSGLEDKDLFYSVSNELGLLSLSPWVSRQLCSCGLLPPNPECL